MYNGNIMVCMILVVSEIIHGESSACVANLTGAWACFGKSLLNVQI